MRVTWERLRPYPGMGSFVAGQLVADLRWALSGNWADKDTWAPMGPGSHRGMNWLLGRHPDAPLDQDTFLKHLRELYAQVRVAPVMPDMEMMDLQSVMCEADKLRRARSGDVKGLRKYPPPRGAANGGNSDA